MENLIKVLHLFNSYLPLSEQWAFDLVRHTPQVEVHIATRQFLPNNFYDPAFKFVTTYQGDLLRIPLKSPPSFAARIGKRIGRHLLQLSTTNDFQIINDYVYQHEIQLVHAHFAPVAVYYLPFLEQNNLPLIVSFYGYDYEYLPFTKPRYIKLYQKIFSRATYILCEGPHGISILEKMGCPKEKLKIQSLGIDDILPASPQKKNKGELKLLQLASFTEKKGQLNTVKAFEDAFKTCPNLSLTLAGDHRDKAYAKKVLEYLENKPWADRISILPWVNYQEVNKFMAKYHVLIQPSQYSVERDCEGGAPVLLLKAQWQGLPIIATKHCDIPNVVKNGETGLLVAEGDQQALVNAIANFYDLTAFDYSLFSAKAQQFAFLKFNIKKNARNLLETYQDVLFER
ncbi:glycosyltransferase family 4 protein [Lewinella sp. LCG006]|uniref:glycosyltransferase family 4 protein n=1 Tax=Lewinella sp. LCG006 TaxID=3231911 RepID=UPI003461320F